MLTLVWKSSENTDLAEYRTEFSYAQGRCIWHNPATKLEDEFDDEEADEEQDEIDEPQPESGPPLLASANEDDG